MAYTDFGAYSHTQLRAMVQALNPGEVMAAGDPWRRAADTLKAIRTTLTRASTEAATTWEGTTSDAFHTRMLHLADRINHAAAYANDAANTLHHVADAIAKAKRDMPEEPGNWAQFKDAVTTFTDDDPTPLAARKKAEAATVMQTLAMHYRTATPMLKAPSPLGEPPKNRNWRGTVEDAPAGLEADGPAAIGSAMAAYGLGSVDASAVREGRARPSVPRTADVRDAGEAGKKGPSESGARGGTAVPLSKVPIVTDSGHATGIQPQASEPGARGNPPRPGLATVTAGVTDSQPGSGSDGIEEPPRGDKPTNRAPSSVGVVVGAGGEAVPAKSGAIPGRSLGRVVGGEGRPAAKSGRKEAFTEGGSGLGVRARARGATELRPGGAAGQGVAPPWAGAHAGKGDTRRAKRPDYLVEDEETWNSTMPANPNVVQ
ncbi:WXG100 family type VII secretion target [Kitasatospora sp. NPDC059408]|uniref:WXG100 family type VII secretion target n=1 Tax=Kitasatospora sp. NPDC059408 TaxID=3346823 RepID=UPI0036C4FD0C